MHDEDVGVSNEGGERAFPGCTAGSSAQAEQTGWMLTNISCVQDGAVFSLTLSLHIQRQMFPKARVEG